MTSYTLNHILIKYNKERYVNQFVPEMFDSKCTPQYELSNLVTMATCWVLNLHNIKGFSVHLWHSIC